MAINSIKSLIVFLIYLIVNLMLLSVPFVDSIKKKFPGSGPSGEGGRPGQTNGNNGGR